METLKEISDKIKYLQPTAAAADQLEKLILKSIEEIRKAKVEDRSVVLLQLKRHTLRELQYNVRQFIQSYRMKRKYSNMTALDEDIEIRWAHQDAYYHISTFLYMIGGPQVNIS